MVEYARLSIHEALELPVDMFMLCRKNYTIDRLMQTEDGRAYLKDCERLKQTTMDFEGLAKLRARLEG